MKMVSIKNINAFTLTSIIIFIIINVEISNAKLSQCLHQITEKENINIDFTGEQAFSYIYNNILLASAKGKNKVYLRQYIIDVFEAGTAYYDFNKVLNPVNWCIQRYIIKPWEFDSSDYCINNLKLIGFEVFKDSKTAAKMAYEEIITTRNLDRVSRDYYDYLLIMIYPHVVTYKYAVGPKKYCDSIDNPFSDDQMKTGGTSEVPIYQSSNMDNSGAINQIPVNIPQQNFNFPYAYNAHENVQKQDLEENQKTYQYYNFLPESSSTATETNPIRTTRLDIDLNEPAPQEYDYAYDHYNPRNDTNDK